MAFVIASTSARVARTPVRCNRRVTLRCKPEDKEFNPDATEQAAVGSSPVDTTAVVTEVPATPQGFSPLTRTQEVINGRSAMLGVIAAAASEFITGQSVFSQVAGKYVNGEIVEKAHGMSWLYFGAIVALLTFASLAPRMLNDEKPEDRENGPWQAGAELLNGRAAMLGFAALLVVEALRGQTPVF